MNLLRIFDSFQPPPSRKFSQDRVGFAVGDIHGRADLLRALLDLLESRAEEETRPGGEPIVVFLGDYIDRGPDSVSVLDLLLEGRPRGYMRHFLKGNHEQAMLAFIADPLAQRGWIAHGGGETMLAYGVEPPPLIGAVDEDWKAAAEQLRARVPQRHLDFLNSLERYVVHGDYAFVHAGVDPSRTLEAQTDADLFWIRKRFLASRQPFSHCVVHGHTPLPKPFADRRRISIDTGAYASGTLTAARLEGEEVGFLSVTARLAAGPAR